MSNSCKIKKLLNLATLYIFNIYATRHPVSSAIKQNNYFIRFNSDPYKRDHNILFVEQYGKYRWQNYSDYNYRALVKTTMFRYKQIIGDKMYSKLMSSQKVEPALHAMC